MLKVTKQADYGLLLIAAIASHYNEGKFVSLKYISEERKLPYRFLGKIVAPLKRVGILESQEGVSGGYRLARHPSAIPVREVLEALGEHLSLVPCVRSEEGCPRFCQCFSKKFWQKMQASVDSFLSAYTVADLLDEWQPQEAPNVLFNRLIANA